MEEKNPITQGPLMKTFILYFVPIFLGSLIQQSFSLVDAFIIGRYAGISSLAAIDATYGYTKLLINVFITLSLGGTVLISQYYGANKLKEVDDAVHTLMLFAIIGGLVIAVVGYSCSPYFAALMKVPPDIYEMATAYLRIYLSGAMFVFIFNIGSAILKAVGDTRFPFHLLLMASVGNLLLDALFIMGFGWGIQGAAYATVCAQGFSSIMMLIRLSRSKGLIQLSLNRLRIKMDVLMPILKLGIPLGTQSALYSISNIYMQRAINSFGTASIAAWAINGKLDFIIWLIIDAIGITTTTFIAQNYGANQSNRMKASARFSMIMGITMVGLLSLFMYYGVKPLSSLFTSNDTVIELSVQMFRMISPFYAIAIVSEVFSGAIKGIGDTFKPMVLTLIGTCAFRIAWIIYMLPKSPTVMTVLLGYPVSWMISTLLFTSLYFFMRRRFSSFKVDAVMENRVEGIT